MAQGDDWVDVPIKGKKEDWQDVPIGQRQSSNVDDFLNEYVTPAIQSIGAGVVSGMGGAFNTVDKYIGAPFRSGVQQAARGEFGKVLPAMSAQFGEDPSKAPSGKDIAMEQGLSGEDRYNTGLILNPFTNETLKLSPAGIAGGVGEAVADPLNFLPVVPAAKGVLKGAQLASKGIGKTAEFVTPYVGKVFARVQPEITREYMKNRLRIKNIGKTKSYEDLKDYIDEDVLAFRKNLEGSRDKRQKLAEMLRDKMREKRFDLQRGTEAPKIADEIHASMEAQKKVLNDLSAQAEDILGQSNASYKRKDILALMDKIGKEAGDVLVGDQITDALKKFYTYRERIASGKKNIDGSTLRKMFRQIRQDTNYLDQAGAYNEDLDRMRMAFSERASDILKQDVPDYAAIMEQAAPRAKSLAEMRKYFGTPEKTSATLQGIRKGASDVAQVKEGVLRQNAELFNTPDITEALNKYEADRNLLERIQRGQDVAPDVFPEDVQKLQEAINEQQMYERLYAPIRRLNPDTDKTQAVVKRFGGPNSSIADRRAIEKLEQYAKEGLIPLSPARMRENRAPISQMMRDKNVYESFNKDATAGSRNVQAFSSIPGGRAFGYLADRFGGPGLRMGIDVGQATKGSIDQVLYLLQNDPKFAAKYGKMFNRVAKGEVRGMVLYHHMLMNNDPQYRAYFQERQR